MLPTKHIILLQALRNLPERLAEVCATLDDEWRPQAEGWSSREAVSHLAACDAPFRARFERIIAEANPLLPYFGPDIAVPRRDLPVTDSIARLRQSRAELIQFLSALPPEAWERPAVHATLGPTTFALQVQNMINHDADHLGQLMDLRAAWEAAHREPAR
jgi:uncharacterized damage-inducible protein DinB